MRSQTVRGSASAVTIVSASFDQVSHFTAAFPGPKLSAKFANVIGGRGVDIKRAEIKNKGTYYRVRIPAGSKQEAQQLCSQYKQAGGSCLVSK